MIESFLSVLQGIGGLDGSLIIGSSSPRSERQQLRGDIDLSRQPFEKLKSLPSVYVEMNITGKSSYS